MEAEPILLTPLGLERQFNLPAKWFKDQAKAGRLPHLRVGRHFRFNAVAVERAMLQLASEMPRVEVAHAGV